MSLIWAINLRPGDYIDLEGDPYGDNDEAATTYAEIDRCEDIGGGLVEVTTSQGRFTCPVDHKIVEAS